MRAWINDLVRSLISAGVRVLGRALLLTQRVRTATFQWRQEKLRRRFRLMEGETPLCDSSVLQRRVTRLLQRHSRARLLKTSGTTGEPKQFVYTQRRLRLLRMVFIEYFSGCCAYFALERTSLFVLSPLADDDSVSTALLEESQIPGYPVTLQAPYRILCHPALRAARRAYGDSVVLLIVLSVADPGLIYSTNPSTLSTFLERLDEQWPAVRALADRLLDSPPAKTLEGRMLRIVRRVTSRGWRERLKRLAASPQALPMHSWAPSVRAYCCWTGGYLKPFLDRLDQLLPAPRYRRIPLFSMSTESVLTVPFFGKRLAFLPMAPGVYYEFRQSDGPLLKCQQLEPGHTYELVVSDGYGLCRYPTGDLFLCRDTVAGLPDLEFRRRRGLGCSLTGEKLSAAQLERVFEKLHREFGLSAAAFLSCRPVWDDQRPAPHYEFLLVNCQHARCLDETFRSRADQLLGEINSEYALKRRSGRLGKLTTRTISGSELFALVSSREGEPHSQFKFLPLYPKLHRESR